MSKYLPAEQLNVKFIRFWPEAGGDLYHDNVTESSFLVCPGDKLEDELNKVRELFGVKDGN